MTILCAFGLSIAIGTAVPGGADVELRNRLTANQPDVTTCTLDANGLAIGIIWHHTANAPDVIEILPPPGYTVDLPRVTVPENANATARVRAILMG
jgi:hypothetical protein